MSEAALPEGGIWGWVRRESGTRVQVCTVWSTPLEHGYLRMCSSPYPHPDDTEYKIEGAGRCACERTIVKRVVGVKVESQAEQGCY